METIHWFGQWFQVSPNLPTIQQSCGKDSTLLGRSSYKDSKDFANAFHSLVEEVLKDPTIQIYIEDVYFPHTDEEGNLDLLEGVVKQLTQAVLQIGLKKVNWQYMYSNS